MVKEPELEYISWREIHRVLYNLSQRIIREYGRDYFDIIIAVAKGGLIPARILSDLIDIEEIGIIGVKFYKGVSESMAKPVLTHPLTTSVSGKSALIVDDVVDSGRTLQLVIDELYRHGASEVTSLALYIKPWATTRPDYYYKETTKWVVFPWEIIETLKELGCSLFKKIDIDDRELVENIKKKYCIGE